MCPVNHEKRKKKIILQRGKWSLKKVAVLFSVLFIGLMKRYIEKHIGLGIWYCLLRERLECRVDCPSNSMLFAFIVILGSSVLCYLLLCWVFFVAFSKLKHTKTWNDLKPPKTIYNHLQPPTTTSKNSTTTSKTSTTTRKQSKTI